MRHLIRRHLCRVCLWPKSPGFQPISKLFSGAAGPCSTRLSRNWWWKLLSGNQLQIKRLCLFFKPFNALESEFLLVMLDAFFDIVFSVAQHPIDQPGQVMGHSDDRLRGAKSG